MVPFEIMNPVHFNGVSQSHAAKVLEYHKIRLQLVIAV